RCVRAGRWRPCPTSGSPSLVNATTEGVVRPPSALGITTGSPPSMTATTEFVVPRAMPMTLPILSPDWLGPPGTLAPDRPLRGGPALAEGGRVQRPCPLRGLFFRA